MVWREDVQSGVEGEIGKEGASVGLGRLEVGAGGQQKYGAVGRVCVGVRGRLWREGGEGIRFGTYITYKMVIVVVFNRH